MYAFCSFPTLRVCLLALLAGGYAPVFGQPAAPATLYRDDYGVPHIYAATEAEAAYVHGWAQAEDRLEQILAAYRWAEGTLATVLGRDALEHDYRARLWRHAEVARRRYAELSPDARAIVEGFTAGLRAFMTAHPERVPAWAPEVRPWHVVALGRAFIWGWPEEQARDDLDRGLAASRPETRGSNAWALSGARTATGRPLLLLDPHLPWATDGNWTEVRLHAGTVDVAGLVVPGLPFVALGHTRSVAWAATTGGPDCADVYEVETDPQDSLRYRFDGVWRRITVDTLRLAWRDGPRLREEVRLVERTHHGPIARRVGTRAYALALAYEHEVGIVETAMRLNRAHTVADVEAALATGHFMPQNIMAADADGHLFYERTGRVPVRPAGYDFTRPVPGNTSATAWQGLVPTGALVHLRDPAAGYMQNCNVSPATMVHAGAPQAAGFPSYVFHDADARTNPRGLRAVALLREARDVDVARAIDLAFDATLDTSAFAPWQRALRRAAPPASPVVDALLRWDGSFAAADTVAVLFRAWREALGQAGAATVSRRALLDALGRATAAMQAAWGSPFVPWGRTLRLRRGAVELPLGGVSDRRLGLETLRNIWAPREAPGGVRTAYGGQSGPMLVSLTDPVASWNILPFGVSGSPTSPHFTDQMIPFAEHRLKPTYFHRADLEDHITASHTFDVPPAPAGP